MNPEKIQDKEAVVQALLELYITPKIILEHFGVESDHITNTLEEKAESFIEKYMETDEHIQISYTDFERLLFLIGTKRGQLNRGGGINENQVLSTIIHAWQKNKIKYYALPPKISPNE